MFQGTGDRKAVGSVRGVGLVLAALLMAAQTARADGFLVPYVGHNFSGDSSCTVPGACVGALSSWGVAFGSMRSATGIEQDIAWAKLPGNVKGSDNSMFSLMSNFLVGAGNGKVQPYGVFGFGLMWPHANILVAPNVTQSFDQKAFGWDYGGGVSAYFSNGVGVRIDFRRFKSWQDVPFLGAVDGDLKLSYWRGTIGVAFKF